MTYAQDKEDDVVLQWCAAKGLAVGSFLDVGAFNGETISNTRLLAENGWSGTLIEPGLAAFTALCGFYDGYAGTARFQLVHAALVPSVEPTSRLLRVWDRGLATTIDSSAKERMDVIYPEDRFPWRRYLSPVLTIEELLACCPGPYAFVSIDAEGSSVELLGAMPLDRMETKVVCIEYNDAAPENVPARRAEIDRVLVPEQWELLFDNTTNAILARKQ